jgi:hypothetical protein
MYGYYGQYKGAETAIFSGMSFDAMLKELDTAAPMTHEQLRIFFVNAVLTGKKETGKKFTGGETTARLGKIPGIEGDPDQPDPKQVAPLFGYLKAILKKNGATRTAESLTTAAAWYWKNVEKPYIDATTPKTTRTSGSSSAALSRAQRQAPVRAGFLAPDAPWHQRPVVWTGIGVALLLLGGVAFWPKKD